MNGWMNGQTDGCNRIIRNDRRNECNAAFISLKPLRRRLILEIHPVSHAHVQTPIHTLTQSHKHTQGTERLAFLPLPFNPSSNSFHVVVIIIYANVLKYIQT